MSCRPRIALFDYDVNEQSPSGSCHLRLLEGLRDEFDFTVFSASFDNPDPSRIEWVRVPAISRPLAARFVSYYLSGAAIQAVARWRHQSFDLIQVVEGFAPARDISYVHYCHRAFLRRHWAESRPAGLRGVARKADHLLRAVTERRALKTAQWVVVPSAELGDELRTEYGLGDDRITVIPNPVSVDRMARPNDFDRQAFRAELGAGPDELLVAFVALGHFERKGLPVLLDALRFTHDQPVGLVVVGGQPDLVDSYRSRAKTMGLGDRVRFAGMQTDVRPYLWAADAFSSPSAYEVFALAPLQAAAAGLPLIVTAVRGVAPFFRDGHHGFAVMRDPAEIGAALARLAAIGPAGRQVMGREVQRAVQQFDAPHFIDRWRAVYVAALGSGSRGAYAR